MLPHNARRKTLAEMAAEAVDNPWECEICGCRQWRVIKTEQRIRIRRRVRECRHCGHRITTHEKPIE